MKIALLQTDIKWGQPSINQQHIEQMIESCPQADIYVLPEMWSTGFIANNHELAEAEENSLKNGSIAWMAKKAAEKNAAVCGSLAIKTLQGKFVNRMYFAKPDGTIEHYDKRHLFSPGGENRIFESGKERKIVEFRGARILLQVCYDLRFPVWSRCKGDYDVAIYVANWPTSRHDVWETLLKARAIENQCYVVGVNRTGKDETCKYTGGSITVDPYGKTVGCCGISSNAAIVDIDEEEITHFRNAFPVFDDSDTFIIEK